MNVENVVDELGDYVTAQVSLTWATRQTAEQYVEILVQSGESAEFMMDDFLEYVRSNMVDVIRDTLDSHAILGIDILDEDGDPVNG
jgi:protocatechuate 3,4-dioxygenase beta subunit